MEKKNTKKKIMLSILPILLLIIATIGISVAFFNYTKTGNTNMVSAGRIAFNSTQTSFNLTNVFPVNSDNIETDTTNVGTVTITITGDTTYTGGIEYLLTATDVQNKVNGKTVPISIDVSANNLGTEDADYFTNRNTATNHIYKAMADSTAYTNNDLLVGYIASGATGVNGTLTIKAYIDEDRIGISDTYDGTESDLMGTTNEWARGRTILTTSEWNSLSSTGLSFKVKVEANEGIWVQRKNLVMKNLRISNDGDWDTTWSSIKDNVTSIEFQTVSTPPANYLTSMDVTDISSTGPVTLYTLDDGLGNDTVKVVIAGDGVIYAPEDCTGIFRNMSKLVTFDSTNFKVDNVVNMHTFFANDYELENINTISTWNTSNVENMYCMFQRNYKLTNTVVLANWDVSNVANMFGIFGKCFNLSDISALANWDVSKVENMLQLFAVTDIYDLTPLANWNVSNVKNMELMFAMDSNKLYKTGNPVIDLTPLANWKVGSVETMRTMFQNVNIKSLKPLKNWNVGNVETMENMFKCDSIGGNSVETLEGLEDWDVEKVTSFKYMFRGFNNLVDASAINDWDIKSTATFTQMFRDTPTHPEFTQVAGTWSSNGTFTPSA